MHGLGLGARPVVGGGQTGGTADGDTGGGKHEGGLLRSVHDVRSSWDGSLGWLRRKSHALHNAVRVRMTRGAG
ncbi:hypothetical protein GCM10009757_52610 [Streptomyces cheonanensis]|uniref:Uncharacterized protein n=1 Tax=Streptomyces cheonanensis TaxID=312720 RepID=A0ABN2VM05_9ACTN